MKTDSGEAVPVHCRLWSNGQTTCLTRTKRQLHADHPSLTFDGRAYDLSDPEHLSGLRCRFLSPNVEAVKVWITGDQISQRTLTRVEVLELDQC